MLNIADPFESFSKQTDFPVHIRVQQRNARKRLITIQGLNPKVDTKLLLRTFKKRLCCNGTIIHNEKFGDIMQLQGDQSRAVATFLAEEKIANSSSIFVHGS
jgi:translation initiation factor 1